MSLKLNPEKKSVRLTLWITGTLILLTAFLAGYVTVTKNCYNAMNEVPITVFSVSKTDTEETVVVFLNEVIYKR